MLETLSTHLLAVKVETMELDGQMLVAVEEHAVVVLPIQAGAVEEVQVLDAMELTIQAEYLLAVAAEEDIEMAEAAAELMVNQEELLQKAAEAAADLMDMEMELKAAAAEVLVKAATEVVLEVTAEAAEAAEAVSTAEAVAAVALIDHLQIAEAIMEEEDQVILEV
jgi:hypothetical protein